MLRHLGVEMPMTSLVTAGGNVANSKSQPRPGRTHVLLPIAIFWSATTVLLQGLSSSLLISIDKHRVWRRQPHIRKQKFWPQEPPHPVVHGTVADIPTHNKFYPPANNAESKVPRGAPLSSLKTWQHRWASCPPKARCG